MNDIWNGAFIKHRDYCGDLTQHIYITDREVEERSGSYVALVTMQFVTRHESDYQRSEEPDGPSYVFEIEVEDPDEVEDDEYVKQEIAAQIIPEG